MQYVRLNGVVNGVGTLSKIVLLTATNVAIAVLSTNGNTKLTDDTAFDSSFWASLPENLILGVTDVSQVKKIQLTVAGAVVGQAPTSLTVGYGLTDTEFVQSQTIAVSLTGDTAATLNVTGYTVPLTPAQIAAADKLRMSQLTATIKAGGQINDEDAIFFAVGGSSAKETAIMNVLDNGGGYPELAALTGDLALTEAMILRCLSIYNIKTDVVKYNNESALALITDFSVLAEFATYLTAQNIEHPPVAQAVSMFRANHGTFNAASAWAATRV